MLKNKKLITLLCATFALVLFAAACGSDDSDDASLLEEVQDRDSVRCGVRDALAGFAVLGADGSYSGFDVEFCRVVAAGVLGDANKVEFIPLETADRFTALQSGEVDVLIRNTTWTATRDGQEGANFLFTTLYLSLIHI